MEHFSSTLKRLPASIRKPVDGSSPFTVCYIHHIEVTDPVVGIT